MALNHISEENPIDIIRFYYNEAFSLSESYRATAPQIALYLLSYCFNYKDLLAANTKTFSVDDALDTVLNKETKNIWNGILTMLLYNNEITAAVTSKLYSNYITKSISALRSFGVNINDNPTKDEFVDAWNEVRINRLNKIKKIQYNIKILTDSSNIESLYNIFLSSINECRKEIWLCTLDQNRLSILSDTIYSAIDNYIKSSGYKNKEYNYRNINVQIDALENEILEGPTKLSYEDFMPLLERIKYLLQSSFDIVLKTSEPKLSLKILTNTVLDENKEVNIQIQVGNDKDSSPIREVSLQIENSQDIEYFANENTLYDSIEGGENHIFKLDVRVSDKVENDKAVSLNVVCKYKNGGEHKEYKQSLSLSLYTSDDFERISNPYSPLADGGPVLDSKMFYGREDFIDNIVHSIIEASSKQIIIYGQKRCGKSSVMYHLKKQLEATGKTFCIFFSIGDIINNLTEASFYYQILYKINEELEDLKEFDEISNVPVFDIPSNSSDFKKMDEDNPLNTFTKYIIKFKRACKLTEGWENKNLVVMIDEFTYLYTEIKNNRISPSIMKQWKAITQNSKAQFSVVLVGQDVVPSFKNEDYAKNAFGVIQDIRLTYLQDTPARKLIEEPILLKDSTSRYVGDAVSRIIDYTSRNPYYIQIFCARLVDYMNEKKLIKITEADVDDIAKSFVIGEQALPEEKFENLVRAGEEHDFQEIPEDDIYKILRQISIGSKNIGFCNRADINVFQDKELENKILKHLVSREVLEKRNETNYRIQVKLFQEWLLNH